MLQFQLILSTYIWYGVLVQVMHFSLVLFYHIIFIYIVATFPSTFLCQGTQEKLISLIIFWITSVFLLNFLKYQFVAGLGEAILQSASQAISKRAAAQIFNLVKL